MPSLILCSSEPLLSRRLCAVSLAAQTVLISRTRPSSASAQALSNSQASPVSASAAADKPSTPSNVAPEAQTPAVTPLSPPSRVFVAGATGQTGQRIVRALTSRGVSVQAGVRDSEKAQQLFVDIPKDKLDLVKFDVLDDTNELSAAIDPRADAVVVATGFTPNSSGGLPNPFLPWQVDCQGTIKIVDAARGLGISRLVLITSILTNAPAWGQAFNPAYLFLNLFGLVLVAKLQAENYIRRSGIKYTIVRPGGLRNTPPKGNLVLSKEDTLATGSISRDTVAEVAVESLFLEEAWFKVIEIVEEETAPKKTIQELFADVTD